MASTDHQPSIASLLTPASCFSSTALRSFLRMSRKQSDDAVHTALPRTGTCAEYVRNSLFPAWYERDCVVEYCQDVLRQKERELAESQSHDSPQIKKPKVDPRFDPYASSSDSPYSQSSDKHYAEKQSLQQLKSWIHQEQQIESIVRDTSATFLSNRCGLVFLKASPTSSRLPVESADSYLESYALFKRFYNDVDDNN